MIKLFLLLKTKDGKALVENFLSLSALQAATMMLPLLTLPYILRVLGYEKYGLIALATSLISYFYPVIDYSFKVTAVREIATNRDCLDTLNMVYSRVISVRLILLGLSLLVVGLIVYFYTPFRVEKQLFIYSSLSLIGLALSPEWFFQGMEKMKYIAIVNIIVRVVFSISVFLLINEQGDYVIYAVLISIGSLVTAIIGQFIVYKKFSIRYVRPIMSQVLKTIRKNVPVFVTQFVPNLYNNSTSLLLGIIANPEALGIYTAIRKIIDLAISLLNIMSRVFYPLINRNKSAFSVYRNLVFSLASVGAIAILLAKDLVFLYLNLISESATLVLAIMTLSVFGFVAYDVFGLNYFIVNRQDRLVMSNTIRSSVIAFSFSIPLIIYFGIVGASITLLLGRTMMGGGLAFRYVKDKSYQ